MQSSLPLLRLLQVADSSFPVGGFAFSHGLEWLSSRRLLDGEASVADVLQAYMSQVGGGQWLPAARAAYEAPSESAILRADDALDASIASSNERAATRAMGERLLVAAADALGGALTGAYLAAVNHHGAPGQYPVAFAAVARDHGVECRDMLAALGFTMAVSITQAAIRLGIIGQAAATRLTADAAISLEGIVDRVLARRNPRLFGAFLPGLETAALLQPRLQFRMFAS